MNAGARLKILGCSSQSHISCMSVDYLLKLSMLEFPQMANMDVQTGFWFFFFSTIFFYYETNMCNP